MWRSARKQENTRSETQSEVAFKKFLIDRDGRRLVRCDAIWFVLGAQFAMHL